MRSLIVVIALALLIPASAQAQDPDPAEFTPQGYEFCGWKDIGKSIDGGWHLEWDDRLSGAYLYGFTKGMSCHAARRNITRVRYRLVRLSDGRLYPAGRPYRTGYTCRVLRSAVEFSDIRCTKIGGTSKFRFHTGA